MLALRLDVDGKSKYYEAGQSAIETVVLTIGDCHNVSNNVVEKQANQAIYIYEDLLEKNANLRKRIDLLEREKEDLEITIDRASRMLDL